MFPKTIWLVASWEEKLGIQTDTLAQKKGHTPKSQERSQKNPDSLILNKNNMITEKWEKISFY